MQQLPRSCRLQSHGGSALTCKCQAMPWILSLSLPGSVPDQRLSEPELWNLDHGQNSDLQRRLGRLRF